ncbi:MAG TPA: YggT family protein [Anaerolineales bacterium]|nr:YggT family protein [Anaerolineales bacterium]
MDDRYSDTAPTYTPQPEKPIPARDVHYLNIKRMSAFFWTMAGLLDGLLSIRFLLKLIGANPGSPFAGFIYAISEPFLIPFRGLTSSPAFENYVMELTALIAIAVYSVFAYTFIRLFWLVFYRPEDVK